MELKHDFVLMQGNFKIYAYKWSSEKSMEMYDAMKRLSGIPTPFDIKINLSFNIVCLPPSCFKFLYMVISPCHEYTGCSGMEW